MTSEREDAKNSTLLYVAEASGSANRVALDETAENEAYLVIGKSDVSERLFLSLREALAARLALVALDLLDAVSSGLNAV